MPALRVVRWSWAFGRHGFDKEWEAVRALFVVGAIAGGCCLCVAVPWEALFGASYFSAFALVALLGLFYRDPLRAQKKEARRDRKREGVRSC